MGKPLSELVVPLALNQHPLVRIEWLCPVKGCAFKSEDLADLVAHTMRAHADEYPKSADAGPDAGGAIIKRHILKWLAKDSVFNQSDEASIMVPPAIVYYKNQPHFEVSGKKGLYKAAEKLVGMYPGDFSDFRRPSIWPRTMDAIREFVEVGPEGDFEKKQANVALVVAAFFVLAGAPALACFVLAGLGFYGAVLGLGGYGGSLRVFGTKALMGLLVLNGYLLLAH